MGRIIIPGNGTTQAPDVRRIDEICEIDRHGNELSRRLFYGTLVLAKVDGKRKLARYTASYRLEPTWHKPAFWVMFGVWIGQMIHTFG